MKKSTTNNPENPFQHATVTLIGSGNLATVMGRVLHGHGLQIRQVYSPTLSNATLLANELGAEAINDIASLNANSAIYLLAVKDDALQAVAAKLKLFNSLVIHTAGSVSKDILRNAATRYGVLWPVKMVRKHMQTLTGATMVADGNTTEVTREIEELGKLFSSNIVCAGDHQRIQMHMLASLTANFSNHLYHLAAEICEKEQLSFSLFYDIITQSANSITTAHPRDTQAGPAFRGDESTIEKHLSLLKDYPETKHIYEMMTESIQKYYPTKKQG
ncbi:MAG TPA: DUF2520 domain-containing protein [Sediminibacterium sp.]|nr:DUF2520 domain-containing protein [Sediminibacterium sp.]